MPFVNYYIIDTYGNENNNKKINGYMRACIDCVKSFCFSSIEFIHSMKWRSYDHETFKLFIGKFFFCPRTHTRTHLTFNNYIWYNRWIIKSSKKNSVVTTLRKRYSQQKINEIKQTIYTFFSYRLITNTHTYGMNK